MKVIIAGGRNYQLTPEDYDRLDDLYMEINITEVVSGCAKGADTCGEQWAGYRYIPIKKFPANWNKYGRAAGMIRNREMAEYADAVVLFPGGKGTQNMYEQAFVNRLTIFDWRSTNE